VGPTTTRSTRSPKATDETGRLRRHVNVFVRDAPICHREMLADKVSPDDRVFILQALSGG
jgi:molybdopterin synthase sulfur carrier subunit